MLISCGMRYQELTKGFGGVTKSFQETEETQIRAAVQALHAEYAEILKTHNEANNLHIGVKKLEEDGDYKTFGLQEDDDLIAAQKAPKHTGEDLKKIAQQYAKAAFVLMDAEFKEMDAEMLELSKGFVCLSQILEHHEVKEKGEGPKPRYELLSKLPTLYLYYKIVNTTVTGEYCTAQNNILITGNTDITVLICIVPLIPTYTYYVFAD
jgi:hypothetical protein